MKEPLRSKLRAIAHSPELFLRDLAPLEDSAVLSPMSEASYRASSFLDNRLVRAGDRDFGIPIPVLRRLLDAQGARPRPIHWLFHVGHCGSTLISRLLGEIDGLFVLREPAVVMGLTRSGRRLDEPGFPITRERWEMLKDLALTLLGRTWRATDTALVKATSDAVNLAPILLDAHAEARALLLYVDLETFLATMLRQHTRRELRLFAREFRIADFHRLARTAPADVEAYPAGRLAAVAWLLHVRQMARLLDDPALAPRTLALSFDDYLGAPAASLLGMAEFLGYPQTSEAVDSLLTDDAASAYAKDPARPYDAARRADELAATRAAHRAEIEDALAWVDGLAGTIPAFAGLPARFSGAREPRAPS
jgi:hypothetical protein